MRRECSSDLAGSDQQRTQVEVAIQWSQHRLPFSPAVDESHLSPAMTNCTTSTARPTGSRYARHKKARRGYRHQCIRWNRFVVLRDRIPKGSDLQAGSLHCGEIWHLAWSDAPIPAADPVDDQAAVFLGCLLPREVTGVEGMGLAVGEQVVEVLVVRPRHEVIVAPGEDLRWRGDRRQYVTQHRVLLRVVPHEPGRLREAP